MFRIRAPLIELYAQIASFMALADHPTSSAHQLNHFWLNRFKYLTMWEAK